MATNHSDKVVFTGDVEFRGSGTFNVPSGPVNGRWPRSNVARLSGISAMRLETMVVHNSPATRLPSTAAGDDLAITGTATGTDAIHITAGDSDSASITRKGRLSIPIPEDYVDGESFTVRIAAKMVDNPADTSCTVDVEAFLNDGEGGVSGDICATAAQSMNSTTIGDYDFTITPTTLVAGGTLDVVITIACVDGATGANVEPIIAGVKRICTTGA